MEQLTIDTGLREYAVNGGPEHGGGVLRFNPSDPNVYSRFCTLQNQLQELEQQVQARIWEMPEQQADRMTTL